MRSMNALMRCWTLGTGRRLGRFAGDLFESLVFRVTDAFCGFLSLGSCRASGRAFGGLLRAFRAGCGRFRSRRRRGRSGLKLGCFRRLAAFLEKEFGMMKLES